MPWRCSASHTCAPSRSAVALAWPALARLGSLHALRPREAEAELLTGEP